MVLNSLNNKMKKYFLSFLIVIPLILSSQYTETINSNRPGTSHGAFAVGKNVLQLELGYNNYNLIHSNLNNSEINGMSLNYNIRYGVQLEKLEVFLSGSYHIRNLVDNYNLNKELKESFISEHKIGLKYLVFDPFINEKWHGENLYSWKAQRRIKLTDFIPAISVFAGGDYLFEEIVQYDDYFFNLKKSNYEYVNQGVFSPFIGIATQNHFKGRWVIVNNVSLENFEGDYSKLNYIFTLTHNLINPRWSVFLEYQYFDSEIYSDNLIKFGVANLLSKNLHVDINAGGSLKQTPSFFYFDVGFSKRFDWHKDVSPEEKERLKKLKESIKQQKKNQKSSNKSSKKSNKQNKKDLKVNKRNLRKSNKSNKKKFLIF